MIELALIASGREEGSAAASIVFLLVVAGVVAVVMWNRSRQPRLVEARETRIRDRLASDGTNPKIVVGVIHAIPKPDQKGIRRVPCVVAVTSGQLIQFGMQEGTRSVIHLVDVAGSTIQGGTLSVHVLNGADRSYLCLRRSAEWKKRLTDLEIALDQATIMAKGAGRGPQVSVADELSKLAALRDEGVLKPGDWERAKDLFLGKPEDERDRAARELRQLHELHKSGVLSQSEFNSKKWDVLARTK